MTDQTEARFLDLDALTPDVKVTIKINGAKHEMAEMSVENFVWAQRMSSEQGKVDPENMTDEDYKNSMSSMIDLLERQFPSCERKELEDMSINKLLALVRFTGKLGAEGAEAAIEEAQEEGKVTLVPTEAKTDQ